jgi:DUF4097 and DUF4098 domain-containing protein YvlB
MRPTALPFSFFAILFFAARVFAASPAAAVESFSQTHPLAADGGITIVNNRGTITVRTWDRAEVRIAGEKHAATPEELRLVRVEVDAAPSRVAVQTALPPEQRSTRGTIVRPEVQLTVIVPATVRLRRIETVNAAVIIEGVRGDVSVRAVNGTVHAKGLAADAALDTVNGAIHAEFASVAAGRKITAHSVNGAVTLALPKDADVAIHAETVNGSIASELPLQLAGPTERNRLDGALGRGSASLKADTVNGSIRFVAP